MATALPVECPAADKSHGRKQSKAVHTAFFAGEIFCEEIFPAKNSLEFFAFLTASDVVYYK